MALSIEIRVPQAVIFDQGTEKLKRRKNDQPGTQASTGSILNKSSVDVKLPSMQRAKEKSKVGEREKSFM